ncbi:hypothetical protein AAFP35_23980 [Gordonia sp. CPCC 206044]|uniref:hypothetical protein n=1 Tax=Gordonia sp. CPCC 206044 TaxID=3140793 RepID=UPI003AF4005F
MADPKGTGRCQITQDLGLSQNDAPARERRDDVAVLIAQEAEAAEQNLDQPLPEHVTVTRHRDLPSASGE